ncbi:hypothetical protein AC578_8430 [Pseudocercospora eumusae]|uniref:Uncharacterized protein n=1 Tax=Pseudocercospora eumusae TaxID=321146 RepID=A0A139HRT3_9PEZI|nr:hypothetical protein AC578_8430 [Pseudocercospora eumusae]
MSKYGGAKDLMSSSRPEDTVSRVQRTQLEKGSNPGSSCGKDRRCFPVRLMSSAGSNDNSMLGATATHVGMRQGQVCCQEKGQRGCKPEAESSSSSTSALNTPQAIVIAIAIIDMAFRKFVSKVRDKMSAKRRKDKARSRAAAASDAHIVQQPAFHVPAVQAPPVQAPTVQTPAVLVVITQSNTDCVLLTLQTASAAHLDLTERDTQSHLGHRNRFMLRIYNADGALYRALSNRTLERMWEGEQAFVYYYNFVDLPGKEWSKLMKWCALTHHGNTQFAPLRWDILDSFRPLATVVKTALDIARIMSHVPWLTCRGVLATFRVIAGMIDPEWLIDR